MEGYVIKNGRAHYLNDAGFGSKPIGFVDDFGNNAVINGEYAWKTRLDAIDHVREMNFTFFPMPATVAA